MRGPYPLTAGGWRVQNAGLPLRIDWISLAFVRSHQTLNVSRLHWDWAKECRVVPNVSLHTIIMTANIISATNRDQ